MSDTEIPVKKISPKYILILILCVVCIIALLVVTKPEKRPDLREIPPTQVTLQVIEQRHVQPIERVSGQLLPLRSSMLSFELSGQVLNRYVEPGDSVDEGEILVTLQRGDYQDALAEAKAQLAQEHKAIERDRNTLKLVSEHRELLEREVKRLARLGQKSLASKSILDEANQRLLQQQREEEQLNYSVETAKARLELKRAAVRRAKRNLARTALSAPFAGIVNTIDVEAGDYVSPNKQVAQLLLLEQLDMHLDVSGSTAVMLRQNQSVTVETGNEQREGQIVALQASPDPESFTHQLRIRLDGRGLQPGAQAVAVLKLHALPDALVVPVSAILHHGEGSYLFIANGDKVRRVSVSLGVRHGQLQVVSGEIRAGEQVVARDVAFLTDGQSIVY